MKIQLLQEVNNVPAVFPVGSVIQVSDSDGQAMIDNGIGKRVPDETPSRIDPTGYMGCVPPQQLQQPKQATKPAQKD
jgi:hypothetical protein